eukprot:CAMPEP_0178448508 /NCGR_PEP_ID=MMETSP0689_2-20121128/42028_1 /TAXON_ID=160604 /ORGANISM="Amphidinium massartii, Strain CS-259" /LENGTH=128 /DNA_ID=CAMNT_0020073711 /DNA_START=48 /DNA_END=430 /DNA_ORIENTATION=-
MQEAAEKFTKQVEETQGRLLSLTLPVERKAMKCALDCYNKTDYKAVHDCVQQCQQPVQEVGKTVGTELESLQSSVQACQQSYQKRLQPRFEAARMDMTEQKKIEQEFEQGLLRCIKEAEPLIQPMEAR